MDNNDLKRVLEEVLDARAPVDKQTHTKHHEFIEVLLDERKRKAERNEKIKTQVIGWGVVALLSAVGTAVYHWIVHVIKSGGQ